MYIILTYDIRSKRVAKGLRICRKYLTHVQKSVFEGAITQKKLTFLQKELHRFLDPNEDSVCIYQMESPRFASKIQFGVVKHQDAFL